MKFELQRLSDYSDESLVGELQRVAGLVATPTLSSREFEEHSKVSVTTMRRRFGNWENALRAANLTHRFDAQPRSAKAKVQRGKGVTKEQVLAELRRVSALLGSTSFRVEDFDRHSFFEAGVVRSRFGSWSAALRAAGLSVTPLGRRYTEDECFENLLDVWTHYGRPPMHREMKLAPSSVGPKAYTKRWGTWNKALHAFVARVDADVAASAGGRPPQMPCRPVRESDVVLEQDRRDIRLGLRYSVLRRDRFRCITCGASPAASIDCRLHVDHVVPFSKGGKTTLDNLRTLCEGCNLGKGDRCA